MDLLNPKRWWFFGSILWHVFDEQETMFGNYGRIVVRVPWLVAWDLAFPCAPWPFGYWSKRSIASREQRGIPHVY